MTEGVWNQGTEESILISEKGETSVDFQRTTRRYISEDGILHNYENLKS
jgi:hypothetical protein